MLVSSASAKRLARTLLQRSAPGQSLGFHLHCLSGLCASKLYHIHNCRIPHLGSVAHHLRLGTATASTSAKDLAAKRARQHGRTVRKPRSKLRSGADATRIEPRETQEPQATDCLHASVNELQGDWGDDLGLTVNIRGRQATFSDGSGVYNVEFSDDGIRLRGALLVGTARQPIWRFPWGVERRWVRLKVQGDGDEAWAMLFFRYKSERLALRQQLQRAMADHVLEKISSIRSAWQDAMDVPPEATHEQRERLHKGCMLVPGVCIKHRKFGYRGVIIGGEPWCKAPAMWRAQMGVNGLARGEAQPFYHCIVDERDRPGAQVTFCAEENIEPSDIAFPVQSKLANVLLLKSNELGGYLPGPQLEEALGKQRAGGGHLEL